MAEVNPLRTRSILTKRDARKRRATDVSDAIYFCKVDQATPLLHMKFERIRQVEQASDTPVALGFKFSWQPQHAKPSSTPLTPAFDQATLQS